MRKLLLLFFILFSVSIAKDRVEIAVNNLTGNGLDKNTINIVSERLRSEFINIGSFRVMSRGDMDLIMKEQGFQQTGMCSDNSCIVEVGQILGVTQIVAGSIGRIGGFYTITLRMLDIQTSEIMYTASIDFDGGVRDLVSIAAKKAAYKLAKAGGVKLPKDAKRVLGKEIKSKKPKQELTKAKTGQIIRRVIFGGITVGGLGAGTYFNIKARENVKELKLIKIEYDNLGKDSDFSHDDGSVKQRFEKNESDAEEMNLSSGLMYGLALFGALGLTISIPF